MTPHIKNILIIVSISVLLSLGILMIIIPCILASNWWPLLSIFVFMTSFIFPVLTNSCTFGSGNRDEFLYDNMDSKDLASLISWMCTGIMVTVGFAIPFELFRVSDMVLFEMLLTEGGGVVILVSIVLFQFLVLLKHESFH